MYIATNPTYSYAFEFQYYFLIVYADLKNNHKVRNGYWVALGVTIASLGYTLVLGLAFLWNFPWTYGLLFNLNDKFQLLSFLAIEIYLFLIFPFKFYIGKEIFFIFCDEIQNNSIFQKIEDLKDTSCRGKIFSQTMVK